jgi:hypothetical protein
MNPLAQPMIQGPKSNTKLVAGAADAGYRECSVRGTSRDLKSAAANTKPESSQGTTLTRRRGTEKTQTQVGRRAPQTRSTATALAVALRGKQNSSTTKYNLVVKRSTDA